MQYRQLGSTDLEISILSYGASPLGSVFRHVQESEGIKTVHTAIDLGINYIDCSPYYGNTLAETVLGKALKEIKRENFYLATKVGRYGDNQFDFSKQRTIESVHESLKRLNTDYIDVIQCHDIEFVSLDQIINETIPTLQELKEQEKVRYIGITGLPLKIFPYVLDRIEVDTILSYCHYSLNDTSLLTIIPYLQEKGAGIINASPLSMGLLTEKGPPDWNPAPENIRECCERASEYCKKHGFNIAQLAVQFSISNPEIHTTLVGTANPDNLMRNIEWIDQPINQEHLRNVQAILEPVKDKSWKSGLDENN